MPRRADPAATASGSRLVYSTEVGRVCPDCGRPRADCRCAANAAAAATRASAAPDGLARVRRETAGRGGKTVTVVLGLGLDPAALAALGQRLRARCGTGGTARDGRIELQGDHVDKVLAALAADGVRAKRAGG
jgi:translation initiation factor 1